LVTIFNTSSNKKEILEVSEHPDVKIFICGPTVYDYSHLGHARIFIVCDVIAMYLKVRGYRPFVLLNLTDIDPKVFDRARNEDLDYKTIIMKYKQELMKDLALINVKNISVFALGTDYIKYMIENVSKLIDHGYAYSANGNIYFDTMKVQGYGELSHQTKEELMMHRIDLAPNKRNQYDFLVWDGKDKFDIAWKNDFGTGIPWWHIQDTSVAMCIFKTEYDIHCGARELLYPHHEAHLAQMKALTKNDKPIRYWVHAGILTINGQKMSKSLGNIIRIRDAVQKYGPDVLRLYILSKHYRNDMGYDENELLEYKSKLEHIVDALKILSEVEDGTYDSMLIDRFYKAMDDDFDTPTALNTLIELCKNVVEEKIVPNKILRNEIIKMLDVFGLKIS